ncbi:Glycosyltransferase [Lachnospiraceae bacterium TWA4]|nr:Glycosyltransferase [Lachnospiraceae bacterium TWA4]
MKILQINNVYGIGSTGKITRQIHLNLLKNEINSIVLYGRGPTMCEEGVIRTGSNLYGKFNSFLSRFTGNQYGGCFLATHKIIEIIKKQKPDIVHIQCINGNFINIYKIIEWLKNNQVRTVITLHAEFMYTANCSHSFDCNQWKLGCDKCPHLKEATGSYFLDRTKKLFENENRI